MKEVSYHLIDSEQDIGQRLDNYLIKRLKGVPKSYIYRIIRGGEVRINKKRAKPEQRLQAQDRLRLPPIRMNDTPQQVLRLPPSLAAELNAAVIFEDEGLLVINKPAGFAVHGGSGLKWGMIEAFRQLRPELSYLELVHRLDRETSGCLILAKKSSVLKDLQAQWQKHEVKKMYWALCENTWVGKPQIRVDKPLLKNTLKSGERMVIISQAGKPALSHVQMLKNAKDSCWLQIHIDTGRTHQIRVHAAFLGHPILGDEKYGKNEKKMSRLFLHAQSIKFCYRGEMRKFVAALDPVFSNQIQSTDWF